MEARLVVKVHRRNPVMKLWEVVPEVILEGRLSEGLTAEQALRKLRDARLIEIEAAEEVGAAPAAQPKQNRKASRR